MNNRQEKIRSLSGKTNSGSAIRSVASPQWWMMKRPGELQWHRQRKKSKLASKLARLRLQINRWLESRNCEIIKETKFHRLEKIGVKTNMTSAQK